MVVLELTKKYYVKLVSLGSYFYAWEPVNFTQSTFPISDILELYSLSPYLQAMNRARKLIFNFPESIKLLDISDEELNTLIYVSELVN